MISVASQVGRLLEVRCTAPFTAADASQLFGLIHDWLDRLGQRSVTMADLRHVGVIDPVLVDQVGAFMRAENPRVERTAFVMAESGAMQQMQLERMLKQGGTPNRRLFRSAPDAEAWLAEVLTPAEQQRLHQFLQES
jgi:hypothetical protein